MIDSNDCFSSALKIKLLDLGFNLMHSDSGKIILAKLGTNFL